MSSLIMNLKEFVEQTLSQIVEGTNAAQVTVLQAGAEVNPHLGTGPEHLVKLGMVYSAGIPVQFVEFDVALTVIEGSDSKAGIGIFSGAVNLGVGGKSMTESSTVSRVKFSVPLKLPVKNK